jgi:hypothetical protein
MRISSPTWFAIAVTLALGALACGPPAPGAPARVPQGPQFQPQNPPPAQAAPIVATDWTGTDGGERVNFYFRKDGILHYRDAAGWWEDGTWTQSGTLILFSTGDRFAEYSGRLAGDALTGSARNRKGKTWSFELRRGTPKQNARFDLAGQTWGGTEAEQWVTFHFKSGGVVEYDTPQGYFTDGTYEIDGTWVFIKTAGDKLEYFGGVDGDRMSGNAWNPASKRWSWSVVRGKDANPKTAGPTAPKVASVEGSTWEGNNGGDWLLVRFDPGGKLWGKDAEGELTGTWVQSGTTLSFEMTGGYVSYQGTLDGAVMKGKARNRSGGAWEFELTRK